jgi:hypothetical protein
VLLYTQVKNSFSFSSDDFLDIISDSLMSHVRDAAIDTTNSSSPTETTGSMCLPMAAQASSTYTGSSSAAMKSHASHTSGEDSTTASPGEEQPSVEHAFQNSSFTSTVFQLPTAYFPPSNFYASASPVAQPFATQTPTASPPACQSSAVATPATTNSQQHASPHVLPYTTLMYASPRESQESASFVSPASTDVPSRKQKRINYSVEQVQILENVLQEMTYPNADKIEQLSQDFNFPEAKIRVRGLY